MIANVYIAVNHSFFGSISTAYSIVLDNFMKKVVCLLALGTFLVLSPTQAAAQLCSGGSGTIIVDLDLLDETTFQYTWSVTNHDSGGGNALDDVYFEIGSSTYSLASVTIPTWSDATAVVDGTWNAVHFFYGTGDKIYNGVRQTFTYTLDQYENSVRIRTIQKNNQTEDFVEFVDILGCLSLPVEVSRLSTVRDNESFVLEWSSISEDDLLHYVVQHKRSHSFVDLASIEARGSISKGADYRYEIAAVVSPASTLRLKYVAMDGRVSYSHEVAVESVVDNSGGILVTEVYPNPSVGSAKLDVRVDKSQRVAVSLFNLLGQKIDMLFDEYLPANSTKTIRFDGTGLAAGTYFIVVSGEQALVSKRLHKLD